METMAPSYRRFVRFAMEETQRGTHLVSLPLPEKLRCMKAKDDNVAFHTLSFQAPKIRLLRSLVIEERHKMQITKFAYCKYSQGILFSTVLDFAVFPKPEFDLPIFCANFFSSGQLNIIVLDLNPLHDVISQMIYKEKYYKKLLPLGEKYCELLPWGGKLTGESIRFFSPIVIWTKFTSSQSKHDILYSAFQDYYKAWLELMDQATEETNALQILHNREAQHKYLTWRAEKDPGYPLLKKLFGDNLAKEITRSFLFDGVASLGDKSFLDYFPGYECEDGTINKKRTVVGKSFETRPWNTTGDFIGYEFG